MAQTKYTCKDCVLLNDEDSEFPYCLYIHTQILTMMLAETLFRWYIRARIVSSSRMGFAMTLMRLGLLLRRIHFAQISSIRK